MSQTLTSVLCSTVHAHAPWQVERVASLEDFLRSSEHMERARGDAFQHSTWLRSWYAQVASQPGVEPLLLSARQQGDPVDALLLPMVRRRHRGLVLVEWADLGVTDYNAPIMREGLKLQADEVRALAKALRRALRGGADVLHLEKTLAELDGGENPLLALPGVESELFGNRFTLPDRYADWMTQLGKHARKEFERQWRVFNRHDGARYVRAHTVDDGLALLRRLAEAQAQRRLGEPGYRLGESAYAGFYEDFLRRNLESGRCVMSALMAGKDDFVAAMFSVHDGERLTMLRIAIGSDDWKACGPGKLLLERTIADLHQQGCREFDLAIGDYVHKRVFQTTPVSLHESCVALSLRGLPYVQAWRLKQRIKRQPALRTAARRLRDRMRVRMRDPVREPVRGAPAGRAATEPA